MTRPCSWISPRYLTRAHAHAQRYPRGAKAALRHVRVRHILAALGRGLPCSRNSPGTPMACEPGRVGGELPLFRNALMVCSITISSPFDPVRRPMFSCSSLIRRRGSRNHPSRSPSTS